MNSICKCAKIINQDLKKIRIRVYQDSIMFLLAVYLPRWNKSCDLDCLKG